MEARFDVIEIGARVAGFAAARGPRRQHPLLRLTAVDQEQDPERHQSGRGSASLLDVVDAPSRAATTSPSIVRMPADEAKAHPDLREKVGGGRLQP